MADLISYEELRRIQNAERNNKALQQIAPDFFEKVREYTTTKKKLIAENCDRDNTFAKQAYEKAYMEMNNITKILDDICSRRHRKVIMQAITNVAARVHNTENMLPEEEEMYNQTIVNIKEKRSRFFEKFNENETVALAETSENLKALRFVDEVPSFVWTDSKTYGPFAKEDIANMPVDVGEILIKQGKAIEIVVGEE
jgi:DNA replication initiation complex subunit (GINS family)